MGRRWGEEKGEKEEMEGESEGRQEREEEEKRKTPNGLTAPRNGRNFISEAFSKKVFENGF